MCKEDKGFTQRLGERISNIYAWASKDKWNMVMAIFVALALVIGIMVALHYFLPLIVLIIGLAIYIFHSIANHRESIEQQERVFVDELGLSAIFSVRSALFGLEHFYTIPTTPNKGLRDIFYHKHKGVHVYTLVFTQFPGAAVPVLPLHTCEQLRQILNSDLGSIFNNSALFVDVMHVPFYVTSIQTGGGQVAIRVVPEIDGNSQAFVAYHKAHTAKNNAIGTTPGITLPGANANPVPVPAVPPTPANVTPPATNEELVDDEI